MKHQRGFTLIAPRDVMLAQSGCAGSAPLYTVEFNTNGSADAACTIQVQDSDSTTRYSVAVTQNTGRVRIE